jgi:predicted unusual protein kinase regulating ubiquinone biosynthesis (AarF/ABC1/UbiB family)
MYVCMYVYIHAYTCAYTDPHGGNLLAMKDGKLAYLDFGMMSEVEPYQRYGILEAVVHMVNRDFKYVHFVLCMYVHIRVCVRVCMYVCCSAYGQQGL